MLITADATSPQTKSRQRLTQNELAGGNRRSNRYPDGFHIHPKVKKLLEQRAEMGNGRRPVDFGMAEALAFGTLLRQGHARPPKRPRFPPRHIQSTPRCPNRHRK